jgi:hypothetical protein
VGGKAIAEAVFTGSMPGPAPFNKPRGYLSKGRLSEISELFDVIDTLAKRVQKPVTFRQVTARV